MNISDQLSAERVYAYDDELKIPEKLQNVLNQQEEF